jgi:hypothetical protein
MTQNTVNEDLFIKQNIKQLVIIWAAITAGLAIFLAVTHFVLIDPTQSAVFNSFHYMSYFSYLSVIVALPGGYYIYEKFIQRKSDSVERNMQTYKTALILKYALFEFAGFFSVVVYLLSGKTESIYMAAIVLAAFLINKPSENSFRKAFSNEPDSEESASVIDTSDRDESEREDLS